MARLAFPPGWSLEEEGRRAAVSLRTEDFLAAIRLFQRVAEAAEALEHHPDLHLEEWNRVRIVTWSHDVGGLTERDMALARAVQAILDEEGLRPGPAQG